MDSTSQPVPDAAVSAGDGARERDALRIQAAAVAAQQAALTEEELLLEERRLALERQEQQLAAHLDQSRQRLLTLRDEARAARATLQQERDAYERRVAEVIATLAQSRKEVAESHRQARLDRERLLELRRRLRRRAHRHWAAERSALQKRQTELDGLRRELERQRATLVGERQELARTRLRQNGEAELARRQLAEERNAVDRTRAELQQRAEATDAAVAQLAVATVALEREQQEWARRRIQLQREAEGLEQRVANLRQKLNGQRSYSPSPAPAPAPFRPASASASSETQGSRRLADVEALATDLADQRLALAEQCARLARARQQWERERQATVAELEAAALRLRERERAVEGGELGLRQRGEDLARLERQVEGARTRFALREAALEAEVNQLQADLQARETLVQERLQTLTDLRRRWDERRQKQVAWLRARRSRYEELRCQCERERAALLEQTGELRQKQRALAERALVLEQCRQEIITRAANPRAAEQRLEHHRRRWAALAAIAERDLVRERQKLEAGLARLDEETRRLEEQDEALTALAADLERRQAAWDQAQARRQADEGGVRRELESLRARCRQAEAEREKAREEAERLARLLMDDGDPGPLPVGRAA